MSKTFVVVGGGIAGVKAAESLRADGFTGDIILIGDEPRLPYDRIPLSLEFLAPKTSPIAQNYAEADQRLGLADFTFHDQDWYRDHGIDLRTGVRVEALDPVAHTVRSASGETVRYDKLLLATGSRARRLKTSGTHAGRVKYLRDYADAVELDSLLTEGSSLAVIGAGWIGLEVAASARQRGVDVTVVGRSEVPLVNAVGPELGTEFARLHRENGVNLRLGAQVGDITAGELRLTDGTRVPADTVLAAVGAAPDLELARGAGLATGMGGVLVDAGLRSSDPDVFAAGDIAAAEHPILGVRVRVEHWANARKQPVVAASGMLGRPGEYRDLPYFFTDQFDLGMEYVGYAAGYRRVVFRGDRPGREFIAFWVDAQHRVLAGMNVNVPGVVDDIKALVLSRVPVDPGRLADPRVPLDRLVAG